MTIKHSTNSLSMNSHVGCLRFLELCMKKLLLARPANSAFNEVVPLCSSLVPERG